jgi:translation elongation factor EF-Ts
MSDLTEEQMLMIRQLREITGSGMMECKRSLIHVNWDFDKAKEYMQNPDNFFWILDRNKNWS